MTTLMRHLIKPITRTKSQIEMPIHGRIASYVGPFVRSGLRSASRYTYNTLRIQDRIIDKTYRKAGLYNRGLVTGIKHGLIGGQIVGGVLNLGLEGLEQNGQIPQRKRYQQRKTYRGNKRYPSGYLKQSSYGHNRQSRCVCFKRRKRMSYR